MKHLHLRSVLLIAVTLPTCTPVATAGAPAAQESPPAAALAQGAADQPGSDAWITREIKERLSSAADMPGMEIHVETRGGMVSLSGQVASQADADRMVNIARTVDGVISVDDSRLIIGGKPSQ
jgi:hyperosmotically inducible protein